jgi:hypothetical protein
VTPSFGSYVVGCLATIGIVSAVGLGGYWLRRWIVPEFSGALARLADATVAVALLLMALQILGSLSILTKGWIIVAGIAFGLGAAALGWWMAPADAKAVSAPKVQTVALLLAIGVASTSACSAATPPGTTCLSRRGSPRKGRRSLSISPTRCGSSPGSIPAARS